MMQVSYTTGMSNWTNLYLSLSFKVDPQDGDLAGHIMMELPWSNLTQLTWGQ